MEIEFLGQPFEDSSALMDFLDGANFGEYSKLQIAVAWAKYSGLGRVEHYLQNFRDAGGDVSIVIGVSEGGATVEGLRKVLDCADNSYVFHDPRRTFHPKVYFLSSGDKRSLLVGSSNLTAGGLLWNYESSLLVKWGQGELPELESTVEKWFAKLVGLSSSCKPLTDDLIDSLIVSSDIHIGSEARGSRVKRKNEAVPEDTDSIDAFTVSGLFAPVLTGLAPLPPLKTAHDRDGDTGRPKNKGKNTPSTGRTVSSNSSVLPSDGDVLKRWHKELDGTAAQHPPSARTNPTGNLRLSKEGAMIAHRSYFRREFFDGLPWMPTPGKLTEQEVNVKFTVWALGEPLGDYTLRVSHDDNRDAMQGNVTTVLHWGELGRHLRENNYVGKFVSLERTQSGGFYLVIDKYARGEYRV